VSERLFVEAAEESLQEPVRDQEDYPYVWEEELVCPHCQQKYVVKRTAAMTIPNFVLSLVKKAFKALGVYLLTQGNWKAMVALKMLKDALGIK